MKRRKEGKKGLKRFLGAYTLPAGQIAVGELKLDGANTLLRVHSDECLQQVEYGASLRGTGYSGDSITLINCHSPGIGRAIMEGGLTKYHAEIFPHYVTVGRRHIDPAHACIASIDFTTTDLPALFYDFDAFGHVIDAKPIIDTVLNERRGMRPVETGEYPQVFYFTGRDCIADVRTRIGDVFIRHRPSYNMGGPRGVYIKNRIVVSIEPKTPMAFDSAMERMYDLCCFLSMAAGRAQGIEHIAINTTEMLDGTPITLAVHPSFRWKRSGSNEAYEPHPGDVPLDPIAHQEEFRKVLTNWVARHTDWRPARGRYLDCMRKANNYDPERLIAAANMFDILPSTAFPPNEPLNEQLEKTRDICVDMFKQLPAGVDRNSALSTLGRLGRPSLPKKILHRASIVEEKLSRDFPRNS